MEATSLPVTPAPPPPRFLDQVRQEALEHYGRIEPAQRCVDWARRFILFHKKRHPSEMGAVEVAAFLKHLADTVAAARIVDELQNASDALSLVYERPLHWQLGTIRLPEPPRLLDRLRQTMRVRHYSPPGAEISAGGPGAWLAVPVRFPAAVA